MISGWLLRASRNLRLSRLRLGFDPVFRDVAIPTRPWPGRAMILASPPETRRPSLKICSKRVLDGPLIRRRDESGRVLGVASGRSARPSFSSARESRVSSAVCGCWVEKCASFPVFVSLGMTANCTRANIHAAASIRGSRTTGRYQSTTAYGGFFRRQTTDLSQTLCASAFSASLREIRLPSHNAQPTSHRPQPSALSLSASATISDTAFGTISLMSPPRIATSRTIEELR